MNKKYYVIGIVGAIVFFLDQLSKMWIVETIPIYSSRTIFPGFFDLVNIRNRGAAFGFLNRPDIEWQFWLFLVATIIAIASILILAYTTKTSDKGLFLGLGLVFGGALGNFMDRLRLRAVVDFLDFYLGEWHWPAFNVADIAICLGGVSVLFFMWSKEKQVKRSKPT